MPRVPIMGSWRKGRLAPDGLLDEVHDSSCRVAALPSVTILADVIPGLDNGAHGQEQGLPLLDLLFHLGEDHGAVVAPSRDFEELAEDAGIEEADAHWFPARDGPAVTERDFQGRPLTRAQEGLSVPDLSRPIISRQAFPR